MLLRDFSPLLAFLPLLACSTAQTQAVGPKTWLLRCESSLTGCVNRAKTLCRNEGYWIVRGHSFTVLAGIEGNQLEEGEHELVIECGIPSESQRRPPAIEPPSNDKPLDTSGRVKELLGTPCVPGETQECVGPGACRGGQQCLDSGAGFSPCDCGKPDAAPPAGPQPDNGTAAGAGPSEIGNAVPPVAPAPPGAGDRL